MEKQDGLSESWLVLEYLGHSAAAWQRGALCAVKKRTRRHKRNLPILGISAGPHAFCNE